MTKLTLDLRLSLEENAQRYFSAAKKARKKAQGAEKAIALWKVRLAKKDPEKAPTEKKAAKSARKKEWYEKFRWCRSSDGFLLVGGRDATTNEMVIKKHAEKGDVVFHTDMAGSPFIVVKSEGKEILETTLEEAAQLCASFSRAWKNGLSSLDVFHVAPDQVTKEAQPGEYLGKGAFMIRGKTHYHKPLIKLAAGLDSQGRVLVGPPASLRAHTDKAVEILQGAEKTSDVAKGLKKLFGGDLDEWLAALPAGGCRLGKRLRETEHF